MRVLFVPLFTASLLVALGAHGLARYAPRHYVPAQEMERGLAAGDGCILFLGDSRMVAALDPAALHHTLQASGRDRCHAGLAIGATDVAGVFLTAREYLSAGRLPRVAVIGKAGDSLLGSADPLPPEQMVGNNAIHLIWSTPRDVLDEVPGFPWASVEAFDRGFRFLVGRSSALGQYQSLVSARVQHLQELLVGDAAGPQNRFGAVGDMGSLEGEFRARAPKRLTQAMHGGADDRYGHWFRALAELLRSRRIPMLVVELPMPDDYRRSVTDTGLASSYEAWLANELVRHGDRFLDLSRADWVRDHLFMDELHIGPAGATLVSTEIGRSLAPMLAASPVPERRSAEQ